MKKQIIAISIAAILWFVMFSPWTSIYLNFWAAMSISAGILILMSFALEKEWKSQFHLDIKSVIIGLVSACLLWGVFYIGNFLSIRLFDFASGQINSIYSLRDGNNYNLIALLLLFWIGPAEVIFWQGYIQRNWMEQFGNFKGFFFTILIYSLVHIWSFNFILVMAACVCGIFWGLMYWLIKPKNLLPLLISHAVWDTMVFIIFPIQ